MIARIEHLSEIAVAYDALICDIWGVVHNGRTPFTTAVNAMREFRRAHGPVILLSNAPRMAGDVVRQLDKIGVARDAYDAIVTSGEATRADLAHRSRERTVPILHLGPPRDNGVFEALNVRLTDVNEADVVLATGLFDDERETADDYRPTLETAAGRGLVMLCANPDVVVRRGDKLIPCAGALADAYEKMGATVMRFGKPYASVFQAARVEAEKRGGGKHPLVVGDNLDTDVRGANGVGFDVLFILGGIAEGEFAAGRTDLDATFAASGAHARAWMNVLAW